MNILDYIEQESTKQVEPLTVEYNGQEIDFHIKNMSQAEIENHHGSQADLLPINKKQENGGTLTAKEAKRLFAYESTNSYQLLCQSDGSPIFETYKEFVTKIKGNFLKAVNKRVSDHTKQFEGEAEKN